VWCGCARGARNQAWADPKADEAPEVLAVLAAMAKSGGCDLLLDVHGDEGMTDGPVLCCSPAWTPRLVGLQHQLLAAVTAASNDFSAEGSLPHLLYTLEGASSESDCGDRMDSMQAQGANLSLCSTQIAHR
jgi:hypothetical protein